MDEVVGVCVLLGGKVVQVGQVLVLGDREEGLTSVRMGHREEAEAQRG